MEKTIVGSLILGMLVTAAYAEENSFFDGGWRFSAGAAFDAGVKTHMHMTPRPFYISPYAARVAAGRSFADARKAVRGEKDEQGRTVFTNYKKDGAKSWYAAEPNLSPGAEDYYGGKGTHCYEFSKDVWTKGTATFTLGQADYAEYGPEGVVVTDASAVRAYDSDDATIPGLTAELSRNLYHDDDIGWGLDVGFGVNFFMRKNAFRSQTSWRNGYSSLYGGELESTYSFEDELVSEVLNDPDLADCFWHGNVMGGGISGEEIGPGIDTSAVNYPDDDNPILLGSDSSTGSLSVKGDYYNLEMVLAAHPYYDVFDWLRINGTLGVAVSRQWMNLDTTVWTDNARTYGGRRSFSQWDVYGVGGLGLMFYYKDFTLSADFMARFFDDAMAVEDRYYHGQIQRGHWMFKLAAGYEF